MMMAMLRLNVPSVFIYGGSILPGRYQGRDVTVQDVFEVVGNHLRRQDVGRRSLPVGAGYVLGSKAGRERYEQIRRG